MRILGFVVGVALLGGCAAAPAQFIPLPMSAASVTPVDRPATIPVIVAGPKVSAKSDAVPVSIRIPAIGVNASSISSVGVTKGQMDVPPLAHPEIIAWYHGSPAPGDLGPSIVISHRNGDGHPGGFAKLDALKVGDTVSITRSDKKTATFVVSKTELLVKAKMASAVAAIYGHVDHAALRLITCSGTLDQKAHNYLDQRVVFADLVTLR